MDLIELPLKEPMSIKDFLNKYTLISIGEESISVLTSVYLTNELRLFNEKTFFNDRNALALNDILVKGAIKKYIENKIDRRLSIDIIKYF